MTTKNAFQIGDTVWWGNPQYPPTGKIVNFSANGKTAFIKTSQTKTGYEFLSIDALRLLAPCGAYLTATQECNLDCPHCPHSQPKE